MSVEARFFMDESFLVAALQRLVVLSANEPQKEFCIRISISAVPDGVSVEFGEAKMDIIGRDKKE